MAEVFAGRVGDLADGARRFVTVGDCEVGVLEWGGEFYAFENRCLHQGGPVCEGVVVGRVEQAVGTGGETLDRRFSEESIHLVCPWHGWEYDLRTGECAGDPRRRLRRYDVVQHGEELYVVA
jgi:nitrite reductase (NADH) small subunit